MTEADQTSGEITAAEAAAMVRTVLALFGRWRITDDEAMVLLGQPSAMYERWRQSKVDAMPNETIGRLADLLAIHKALRAMFVDPEQGYGWIARPNDAFAGRSALDRMLDGAPEDIRAVRDYLDAERKA